MFHPTARMSRPTACLIENLSAMRCRTQPHVHMCALSCSHTSPDLMKHFPYPLPSLSVFPTKWIWWGSNLPGEQSVNCSPTLLSPLSTSAVSVWRYGRISVCLQPTACCSFSIAIPIGDTDFCTVSVSWSWDKLEGFGCFLIVTWA